MAERTFLRWDRHQRLQHLLLILSVTTLVLTGLPLKYTEAGLSRFIMRTVGGPETAGIMHRTAAILLALAAVYHLLYLGAVSRRQGWATVMWPRGQDVRDLMQMLRYFVGLSPHPPRFGRYSYTEKFEYWAVVWGTLIMLATGFMLWFPVGTAGVFSVLVLHIAQVIHSYEALLAALSLIIWHFYHAHLNPDVFPMSKVWLTGRITEKEFRHHHPLEYERLQVSEQGRDEEDDRVPEERTGEEVEEVLTPAEEDDVQGACSATVAEEGEAPRSLTEDETEGIDGAESENAYHPSER